LGLLQISFLKLLCFVRHHFWRALEALRVHIVQDWDKSLVLMLRGRRKLVSIIAMGLR
jgi:hypothetical protein